MAAAPTIAVRSVEELASVVSKAGADGLSLQVCGGGSKAAVGGIVRAEARVDLTALSGITRYEPEELVLRVRAGTPIEDIESALTEKNQMLAFEPPDYARLLGAPAARTTVGGIVGSGFAGPRRLSAGSVRDHLLGFTAVSGRGERFVAGGAVIKNVTGYDLPKLMTGSWGTLAILTDLNLKVLPRPQTQATLVIEGLSDRDAVAAMTEAMAASVELSGAAHLPLQGIARTALRIEGFDVSVSARVQQLFDLFSKRAAVRVIGADESAALWRGIRDVDAFAGDARILWRLSLPPAASCGVVARISETVANDAFYDWSGGLVWMALRATTASPTEASAALIRKVVADAGGTALLMRASEVVRSEVPAFHPQQPALAALNQRIKHNFDPSGVLERGRMNF